MGETNSDLDKEIEQKHKKIQENKIEVTVDTVVEEMNELGLNKLSNKEKN